MNPASSEKPLVSVVIPTYNQEKYLGECLDSVFAQDYPNFEVIVVDNASTDDTKLVITKSGKDIRYERLPENRGPSAARNAGRRIARGSIIAYVDGDDTLLPDCLSARVDLLLQAKNPGMVVGALNIVDEKGGQIRVQEVVEGSKKKLYDFETTVKVMNCPTCGLLITTDALDAVGGWDVNLWSAEDSDLLIRVAAKFECLIDVVPRANYRQIPGSLAKDPIRMYDSYEKMLRKNLAVAPNPERYKELSQWGFRERMVNNILGNILKDNHGKKVQRMLRVMGKRPKMISYFGYWVVRVIKNRIGGSK